MRYISDDGKVFNTEQECCEHEQKLKQEIIKREELKLKQKERYDNICKHHNLLMEEINSYIHDYGLTAERVYDKFGNILYSIYKYNH